jgi:molybdopterin converting factor small subunit
MYIPKYNINDIIVITFNSAEVNYGIKCLADETFAEVEEKLYKRYNNLRETNNMFTVNAKPILRFKKIKENNIKDGDIIQLFKLE